METWRHGDGRRDEGWRDGGRHRELERAAVRGSGGLWAAEGGEESVRGESSVGGRRSIAAAPPPLLTAPPQSTPPLRSVPQTTAHPPPPADADTRTAASCSGS